MLSLSEHCPDGIRFMSDFFAVAYFYGCFFCFQCLPLFASPLPVFTVLVVRCANQRVNVGTWGLQVFVCGAIVSLAHFHL